MDKWEYKIEVIDGLWLIERLNAFGKWGWEVIYTEQSGKNWRFIFKRKIKE